MSNYPPGAEFDKNAPFNQNDYEYEINNLTIGKNCYLEIDLVWSSGTPEDSIYFPTRVKIDMEKLYDLIDNKLGR